jgi:DNA polymerase-3 subunit gamma/tau
VSYLVLARKYRPQTFEDLVGQDHVARTLANAIAGGRVAHAFLFTGVRGVGKTTSARLLAKCLNCVGPDGKLQGPTAKPCNECAPCREITAGQDLDVQEIDGASYNGVDEVRRLQEGVSFRPARDRFKIYVVDEVHMLSTAAWNAFLKTLEEPPPHVKFIFATTEVHKVPVTILSRCQRYDFKLISTRTIAHRLEQVLAQEKIEAEGAAVQVLAREAAGSMRDAMSLLDQVIAFSGTKLTADDVTRVLGVADRKILHDLATALVTGDAAACVAFVDRVSEQGFDLSHVAKDVLRHLRNLVVAKVCSTQNSASQPLRELLDLADEEVADVVALTSGSDVDDLSRLFQGFSRVFDEIVRSGQPRMSLEMALVKLARRPPLLALDELLARVGELERRLGGAPSPGPLPRGGGGGGGGGSSRATGHAGVPSATSSPEPPRTHGTLALAGPPVPSAPVSAAPPVATASPLAAPAPRMAAPPVALATPITAAPPVAAVRPVVVPWAVPPPAPPAPPAVAPAAAVAPAPAPVAPAPAAVSPSPAASDAPHGADAWNRILERVRAFDPPLASVLEHAMPLQIGPAQVTLGFDASGGFLAARASEPAAREVLARVVREHFGAPTPVTIDGSAKSGAVRTVASIEAERRSAETAKARAAVESHPLVREATRLFDAKLREVKLPNADG